MPTKIPDLQVEKFTAPDNTIPASKIQESVSKKFVTDAEKTKITDLPNNTTLQSDLNAKQDTLVSGTNIKTVNNQSLLGSGNLDIAGGSSVLKSLEGEARYDYVPYIDIPLELDNYESQTLKTTNLLNDTSAVRMRFQFLDNEGNPITSTNYFWGNGYITNSQNQSATEYGNNSSFGSLTGERLQSGLSNDIAGNITKLDIEIKKYSNGTYNLLSKFQYLDTNLYSTGSFIENKFLPTAIASSTYTQTSVYTAGLDANFTKMTDSNFATGGATSSLTGSYIQMDLGSVKLVEKIFVGSPNTSLPGGWNGTYMNGQELQYSVDGIVWNTLLVLPSFADGELRNYSLNQNARYIRLYKNGYVVATEFYATTLVENISGIRIFPSSGNIKGIFYKYALQKSNVAQQTQSVVAPLQTSSILEVSAVQKVIDIPEYPV